MIKILYAAIVSAFILLAACNNNKENKNMTKEENKNKVLKEESATTHSDSDKEFAIAAYKNAAVMFQVCFIGGNYTSNNEIQELALIKIGEPYRKNFYAMPFTTGDHIDLYKAYKAEESVDAANKVFKDVEKKDIDRLLLLKMQEIINNDIILYQQEIKKGRVPAIKDFAEKTIPELQNYKQLVDAAINSITN